jgi:L-fucose mutarotase
MSASTCGKPAQTDKTQALLFLMLKNLPPLLTPDALHALASMGHGDELAIVDANFPAERLSRAGGARLVQLAGATAPEVLRAVLQVLPLDDFGPVAAWSMQVVGDEAAVPPAVAEFQQLLASGGERPAIPIERFEFYRRAEQAAVIFRSGEQRTYGNLLLRKGVVA